MHLKKYFSSFFYSIFKYSRRYIVKDETLLFNRIIPLSQLTKFPEMKSKRIQSDIWTSDPIRLKKMACDVLNWSFEEMQLLLQGAFKGGIPNNNEIIRIVVIFSCQFHRSLAANSATDRVGQNEL